ncbi:MAG: AAA family ATPase, partial [Bacillota bacterium]|nr:AAA family ATPase [Bacillota bacterium]
MLILLELRIKRISIQNFKGIKSFELSPDGYSINIYGDNRTGKTTIFDAFTWCLFGKDSLGQANFEIKPLKDGKVIHNLETVVEILFNHDGKDLILKRLYREVWKNKRGMEADLTGHETLCYINEEKVGVKNYEDFIKSLIDEDVFRIITDVRYFPGLKTEKQRELLYKLVSDITDNDIIAGDEEIAPLWEHLKDGQTVETLQKILKDKLKKINEELTDIPNRIDERHKVTFNLPDDYDDEKNDEALSALYKRQSELEKSKATGQADNKIAEYEKSVKAYDNEIVDLKYKMEQAKRQAEVGKQQAVIDKTSELNRIRGERQQKEIELNNFRIRKEKGLATIEEEKAALQKSYDEYRDEQAKTFTPANCRYCGQPLPQHMLAELEKKFNLEKAECLTRIKEKGEATKANIEKYIKAVKGFEETIAKLEAEITALKDQEA